MARAPQSGTAFTANAAESTVVPTRAVQFRGSRTGERVMRTTSLHRCRCLPAGKAVSRLGRPSLCMRAVHGVPSWRAAFVKETVVEPIGLPVSRPRPGQKASLSPRRPQDKGLIAVLSPTSPRSGTPSSALASPRCGTPASPSGSAQLNAPLWPLPAVPPMHAHAGLPASPRYSARSAFSVPPPRRPFQRPLSSSGTRSACASLAVLIMAGDVEAARRLLPRPPESARQPRRPPISPQTTSRPWRRTPEDEDELIGIADARASCASPVGGWDTSHAASPMPLRLHTGCTVGTCDVSPSHGFT